MVKAGTQNQARPAWLPKVGETSSPRWATHIVSRPHEKQGHCVAIRQREYRSIVKGCNYSVLHWYSFSQENSKKDFGEKDAKTKTVSGGLSSHPKAVQPTIPHTVRQEATPDEILKNRAVIELPHEARLDETSTPMNWRPLAPPTFWWPDKQCWTKCVHL